MIKAIMDDLCAVGKICVVTGVHAHRMVLPETTLGYTRETSLTCRGAAPATKMRHHMENIENIRALYSAKTKYRN